MSADLYKVYSSVPSAIDLNLDGNNLPVLAITALGAGNLITKTHSGASVTIPVTSGQTLKIEARSIETGTTSLPLLVFWGYGEGGVFAGSSGASGGGDATAANQDEQTALLTSIEQDQRAQKYLFSEHKKITSIPSGGVNLRTLVPGKEPVFIAGTPTSGSGALVWTLFDDDDSDPITTNFGPNGSLQGIFGKIFDTTNNAILPIRVFFA